MDQHTGSSLLLRAIGTQRSLLTDWASTDSLKEYGEGERELEASRIYLFKMGVREGCPAKFQNAAHSCSSSMPGGLTPERWYL